MPTYELLCSCCGSKAIGTYSVKNALSDGEIKAYQHGAICADCRLDVAARKDLKSRIMDLASGEAPSKEDQKTLLALRNSQRNSPPKLRLKD